MTGTFDDSAKEEIRQRADIAAIVGRYVKLKPSGQTLKGLCPFHKEKTPSFHVNPSRQFFHCFGCGKGGDVFTFLQEIEGHTFPEVLKMLAEETGVKLAPGHSTAAPEAGPAPALSKTVMLDLHAMAADFFYNQVRSNEKAIAYFKSRGLAAETVRSFRLGYAPAGWSALIDYCARKKVPADALVSCGLAVRNENGSVYDRFRDRIMFALYDLSGRIVAFAGRGMDKETTPKYLNSPETPIYRKKELLYGLNITRPSIKEEKCVLVVEGYMDFLTLFQAGIKNAVATSGTAMTPEHAQVLKRFASRVILVFDGDRAGQMAAQRGVFTLAPFDLDVSVLVLPPEEDPDSYVKKYGAAPFRNLAASATTANEFIIDKMIAEHGGRTPRGQKAVIEQLSPLVAALNDPLAISSFKKDLADRLGVDEKMVYHLFRTALSPGAKEPTATITDDGYVRSLEGSFLHILITRPELIREARRYIAPETLTDGISGDIYLALLVLYDEHGNLDGIIDRTNNKEVQRLISCMLVKPALEEHIHEELVQKIFHLRKKFLRTKIREINVQMKRKDADLTFLLAQLKDYSHQLRDLEDSE